MVNWTRCSFLPGLGEVPSAHRAFEMRRIGGLRERLGYDASTGVRDVASKRGSLDPLKICSNLYREFRPEFRLTKGISISLRVSFIKSFIIKLVLYYMVLSRIAHNGNHYTGKTLNHRSSSLCYKKKAN